MEIFGSVFTSIYNMLTYPINIYGFTVTLWGMVIFTLTVGMIFGLIGRLFNDE